MNSTQPQPSDGNDNDKDRGGDFMYTNTFENLPFGLYQNNPNPEQQQARPHDGYTDEDQVFQVPTAGEPSDKGNYAIGSGIARPKSAPSHHLVGGQLISENNNFEDVKAKIQAGYELEDQHHKPSSEGRKKRCNSDTGLIGAESFFETFAFGNGDVNRGDVPHMPITATNPCKRSRSADAANLLPDIEKLLATGINYDSDDEQNGDISGGIMHNIEPIEVSFGKNQRKKRCNSDTGLIGAESFFETFAFGNGDVNHGDLPHMPITATNPCKRSRSADAANLLPDIEKLLATGINYDSDDEQNGDISGGITHNVLELDGSISSFDSDKDQQPNVLRKVRGNNSAPLLSDEFLDTVFDDKFNDVWETDIQTDVNQELDVFVISKIMNTTRKKGAQAQTAPNSTIHRRRKSHDGIASSLPLTSHPSQDENLALYNMLISCYTPDQNNIGFQSFVPMGMLQSETQTDPCTAPTDYATSRDNQAGEFILNAAKTTQNELEKLHLIAINSGDKDTAEEIQRIFQIYASASQFVGSLDINNAFALMNQAQTETEALFHRISIKHNNQQSPQEDNRNASNIMITSEVPSENVEQKILDTGCVYPSMTKISLPSQSNSPLIAQPPYLDSCSIGTNFDEKVDLCSLLPEDITNSDIIMARLQCLMKRTQSSQKQLQQWDKNNGLPKSHSQTMVNSSRSRKQLQKGVILKKWNGTPLI